MKPIEEKIRRVIETFDAMMAYDKRGITEVEMVELRFTWSYAIREPFNDAAQIGSWAEWEPSVFEDGMEERWRRISNPEPHVADAINDYNEAVNELDGFAPFSVPESILNVARTDMEKALGMLEKHFEQCRKEELAHVKGRLKEAKARVASLEPDIEKLLEEEFEELTEGV